jgi:hypothetical protein
MTDSFWGYNPQIHPDSGKRVYAEMNTGDLWKLGDEYLSNQVNCLDPALHDGLPHRYCLVIFYIDGTLVDWIG